MFCTNVIVQLSSRIVQWPCDCGWTSIVQDQNCSKIRCKTDRNGWSSKTTTSHQNNSCQDTNSQQVFNHFGCQIRCCSPVPLEYFHSSWAAEAFLAIVARMGGDCWGAAEKIKERLLLDRGHVSKSRHGSQEDPKQLYQQFRVGIPAQWFGFLSHKWHHPIRRRVSSLTLRYGIQPHLESHRKGCSQRLRSTRCLLKASSTTRFAARRDSTMATCSWGCSWCKSKL